MDFVPLRDEQYDLVIPQAYYGSDLLRPLLDLIRSAACQHQVEALGGYDVTHMGEVIAEIPAVRGRGVSD
jgi:putative molybdopterin biosynthesis protein